MFVNGLEVGTDGRVLTSLVPVALTDPASGGFTYDPLTGGVKAANVAPVYYANGWPFNAGQLCVGDGPAVSYRNGLGFNSAGQLVVDGAGAVISARGGWPMTAAGVAIKPTAPSGYGATDPAISKVILLSHMENSTASTDTPLRVPVGAGPDISAGGFSRFSTLRPRFGARSYETTSLDDKYNGSGTGWQLGAGDFAMEFWIYPISFNAAGTGLMAWGNNSSEALRVQLLMNAARQLQWYIGTGFTDPTGAKIVGTTPVTANAQHFVQAIRISGVLKLGLDGVQEGASYTDPNNYSHGSQMWGFASNYPGGTDGFRGTADEIRFTRDVAGGLVGVRSICLPTTAFANV